MPRNKVLERAKVSAPTGRNEFDLSRIGNFTAMAGYQQVVLAQPVPAGTHGRLNRTVFTRTADVVAPAFPQVTQHVDFFIVNCVYAAGFVRKCRSNQMGGFSGPL